MYNQNTMKTQITSDLYYIGSFDRRIALFENVYPVSDGVTYNSYLLTGDEPVIFDTADGAFTNEFLRNAEEALAGKHPAYLIVSHMEPDHSASIKALAEKYPAMKIVVNARSKVFLEGFFPDLKSELVIVKEGDTLTACGHTLKFMLAPMVHWPEVMFTYDETDKTLFSADAFGTFGTKNGIDLTPDRFDEYLPEARRYYTNIVGKYGTQVLGALKKVTFEVDRVCPLHGPVLSKALFEKAAAYYTTWASYAAEKSSAVIAYASVYGNTKRAAEYLKDALSKRGVSDVVTFDVSKTHFSYILAECFLNSHIVLASITYNAGIFTNMETLISEIVRHDIANRKFSFIENGSWAAQSGKLMREALSKVKNAAFVGETVSFRSSLKAETYAALDTLADSIAEDIKNNG